MPLNLANHQTLSLNRIYNPTDQKTDTKEVIEMITSFVENLAVANGITDAQLLTSPPLTSDYAIPNHIIVTHNRKVIAAIDVSVINETKFSIEFPNYAQRITFAGHEFQRAYQGRLFGDTPKPFVGTILLFRDQPNPDDRQRTLQFGQRMLLEQLYSGVCPLVLSSERKIQELAAASPVLKWTSFVADLASRLAFVAVMKD